MTQSVDALPRRAFSLLEVVLAVGLSGIVVYLIAGAIEFHLRELTVRQTRIEEARIARAILGRIADDLRAVVLDRPIDLSSLNQLAQATPGREQEPPSEEDAGNDSASDATSSSSTTEAVETDLFPSTPGIYGNAFELQIDVGRIPRYEEYAFAQQLDDLNTMQTLSDVHTVAYFLVGQPGMPGFINSSNWSTSSASGMTNPLDAYRMLGLPGDQPRQGLGRRSLDRAATRYALENAGLAYLDEQTELFAPEVAFIQFRYFDGLQWIMEWDTQAFGGIPMAVEIVIVLQPQLDESDGQALAHDSRADVQFGSLNQNAWQFDPDSTYRLVVHLPGAEPIDTTTALQDDTTVQAEGTGA